MQDKRATKQKIKFRRVYKAFTLVELIIVIVAIMIISGSSSLLLTQGFSAFSLGRNILNADWQARVGLERMIREIRAVRSARDIITASANTFTFIDINGNTISFTQSGTQLMRTGSGNNPVILADGVQGLTFTYYDGAGNSLGSTPIQTQFADINYIVITLNIAYNNVTFTVTTAVYPWNLL